MSLQKVAYGFIPTSISNCALWLDAADSSTVTLSGSTATQWNDKSGNGKNSTSCSATYSNGINGLGCMTNPVISGPITNSGSSIVTIFIVGTKTSTGGLYDSMLALNLSPITNYYGAGTLFACYYGGTSPPQFYCYMNGNLSLSFVGAVNTPFIFNVFQTGTTGSTYGNGTSYGDVGTAGSTFNYTTYYIGACTGGPAWIGNIGEIIVYNSILSISQRQQVEGYLAQKWGLKSSLPVTHPGLGTTLYRSDYTKQNIMRAIPYYVAFSPRSIAGCALWLDGADPAGNGVVPSQGSQIGSWVDKSGNGRTMTVQGTAANITYTKVNGINAVWFNNPSANNAYMKNTSFPVIQNGSVFMVFVPLAYSAVWNFLWSWNPTASNYLVPGIRIQQDNKSLQFYLTFYGSGNYGTANNGTTYLSYFDWTNTTSMPINWSINGTVPPTSSTVGSMINNTGVSEFDLGNDTGATMPYGGYGNMYLSEMIIYNSVLNSTQRQQVESYLAQKWGLTASLPGGHLQSTQPAGAVTTTALANYRTVSVPRRYVSFKWTITAGNTESLIQFSEFQVGFNGTQLVFASPTTATTGSSISWNTGAGEGPAQAVDNNLNTKGLGIGTSGLVLIVTVATPIAANMYRWATANDVTPGRNPTQWTVDGSVDGVTFVRLHTQNTTYSTPSSTFTYTSWIPFTYS
jgi:hypothetical protein